jgi:hypothetical protein
MIPTGDFSAVSQLPQSLLQIPDCGKRHDQKVPERRRIHDNFRREEQEIFFTDPEREEKQFDMILKELEEYSTRGARITLNGVESAPRTIANVVAENGRYMREYEFSREGRVKVVDFRSVKNY